jgi:hypothetical protein
MMASFSVLLTAAPSLYQSIDGLSKPTPLGNERLQSCHPRGGQPVVATRRPLRRLLPRRLDQTLAAKARQKRIDRALARHQPIARGKRTRQLEPIHLAVAQQRQHAVLDRAAAHLRHQPLVATRYHARHSTRPQSLTGKSERFGKITAARLATRRTALQNDPGETKIVRSPRLKQAISVYGILLGVGVALGYAATRAWIDR